MEWSWIEVPIVEINNVRLGVIGLGLMGSAHAVNVAEGRVPGLELAAVASNAVVRPGWAAPVRCFSSAEEMIRSSLVDAVLIATPHISHKAHCVQALKAGLHVMVDKPLGVHKRAAEEICEAP